MTRGPGGGRRRGRRLLAAALLLAGCGSGETAARVRSLGSWGATARLVGERWAAGELPDAYATATLARARAELHASLGRLGARPGTGEVRARALALLEAVDRLGGRVRAGDRPGAATAAGALPPLLDALTRAGARGPAS